MLVDCPISLGYLDISSGLADLHTYRDRLRIDRQAELKNGNSIRLVGAVGTRVLSLAAKKIAAVDLTWW
jgi:hypothetical protein